MDGGAQARLGVEKPLVAIKPSRVQLRRKLYGTNGHRFAAFVPFPLKNSRSCPRKISPDFLQYIAERPEMVSHDEEAKKAKTTDKRKINMKNRNVNCRTTIPALFVALAFSCLCSVTAQAGAREAAGGTQGSAIVGTWHVQVFFDPGHTQLLFESYKQWHSDGLEFESANIAPGVLCVGTWTQIGRNTAQLYHVGWTYGIPAGTYRFVWTETETVSSDGNNYDGSGQITYYDENGNQVGDPLPTYPHATRLPPQ